MRHLSWDEVWEWAQGAELPAAKRSHAHGCPVCAERVRRCEELHRALVCTLTAGVGVTAGDDDALLAFLRQEAGPLLVSAQAAGFAARAADGSASLLAGASADPVEDASAGSGAGSSAGPVAGRSAGLVSGVSAGQVSGVSAGQVSGVSAGPVASPSASGVAGSSAGSRPGRANRTRRRWIRAAIGIGAAACAAAGVSWPSLEARWVHGVDDAGSAVAVATAGREGSAVGGASDVSSSTTGSAATGDAEGTAGGRHAAGRSGQGTSAGSTALAAADGTGGVGRTAGTLGAAAPADRIAGASGSAGGVTRQATQSAANDGSAGSASWVQTAGPMEEAPSSTGAPTASSNGPRAGGASTTATKAVQNGGPVRVQGRVQVRASDGRLLSGATVTFSAGGRVLATARTSGDGWTPVLSFVAPADPMLSSSTPSTSGAPGVAVVTVECPGYRPAVVYEVGLADGAWMAPVVTLEPIPSATPNPVRPNPIPVTSSSATFQA